MSEQTALDDHTADVQVAIDKPAMDDKAVVRCVLLCLFPVEAQWLIASFAGLLWKR
jgi:hypothetical protein